MMFLYKKKKDLLSLYRLGVNKEYAVDCFPDAVKWLY